MSNEHKDYIRDYRQYKPEELIEYFYDAIDDDKFDDRAVRILELIKNHCVVGEK